MSNALAYCQKSFIRPSREVSKEINWKERLIMEREWSEGESFQQQMSEGSPLSLFSKSKVN